MLRIDISGREPLELSTLVLDFNGTLARDGELLPGVAERLVRLAALLRIIVLTADTHGSVVAAIGSLPVEVVVIAASGTQGNAAEDVAKLQALEQLGPATCAAMGNGRNDTLMLQKAALAIAVMGEEGVATPALLTSQVVVRDIRDGLDLLLSPDRLRATLRC